MQEHHDRAGRTRLLRRLPLIALFGAVLVASGLAGGSAVQAATPAAGGAGNVVPYTAGPRCTYGSSSGNVQTCVYVEGPNGTQHVDYAWASAQVINAARTIEVCPRGPQGPLKCWGFGKRSPGDPPVYALWQPNATEPAGDYCANTYRLNSDGSDTRIGHVCVNVHS